MNIESNDQIWLAVCRGTFDQYDGTNYNNRSLDSGQIPALKILLFEDSATNKLDPVTTGRAVYTVTCASYRLIDLVNEWNLPVILDARPHLRPVVQADFPGCQVIDDSFVWESGDESVFVINGRLAPTAGNLKQLETWKSQAESAGEPLIVGCNGYLLAALIPANRIAALRQSDYVAPEEATTRCDQDFDFVQHLHDLIRINQDAFCENMERRLAVDSGNWHEIADGVFSRQADASMGSNVVADTHEGPILLESGVNVGPFTFLQGPLYFGPNCKIAEHSSIKEYVCTGTTCKLGGEIEASIIESYSNKQHHGFLGHAYLGSWINLGAGTCNSDLKNTYGLVNMQHHGEKIATGMQFVGCFIGDYAKTAINTSIFTGKTIGVASMVYGIAGANVPAFTNDAQVFERRTEVDPSVMIQTQKRMFGRRNVTQRQVDIDLMQSMFELTASGRVGLNNEPLVF